jgi:hypothetical protein
MKPINEENKYIQQLINEKITVKELINLSFLLQNKSIFKSGQRLTDIENAIEWSEQNLS